MVGRTKAKARCPHCGHHDIVTVLKLTTNDALKKGTITKMKSDWPLIFYKTICRECNKSVTNRTFHCTDGRFNKYEQRMEFQFYFNGLLMKGVLPLSLLGDAGRVTCYWKCKRCLRTWSEGAGADDFKICPRCGIRTFVRIIYGDSVNEYTEAAERSEVRLGGRIVDPANPKWVCLECDYHA